MRIEELPANLGPPSAAPYGVRLFALLTIASTVVFSLIAALLLHYWEAR